MGVQTGALPISPRDVEGLRKEWIAFRENVGKIPPQNLPSAELLRGHWEELKAEAAAQHKPVFAVSSLMALSAISRTPDTLLRLARAPNKAVWRTVPFFCAPILAPSTEIL